MSNLLATKLHRPLLPPKRVQRPQLIQRLNDGLEFGRQITLISAPAGFGKTVCVCEWLEELDDWPITWLSLEAADDDPGRFFTYLVAALQKIDATIGAEIEGVLRAGQLPLSEIISTTLVNDIIAIRQHFLLILDDFHVIQDEFILQVLEQLISNLPQVLYLVLLTREDPPLPLARLRANNQLAEIRAADLRFSPREIKLFLRQSVGLYLSQEDINALADRTEGWIAGLHLAGLSIRERSNPSAFIANLSGSHRFILNYLTEEVLNQQPAEIQDFLLQTSILERLSGDLCNAVTERTNSHEVLEHLLNANLFLIPLDDEGHWYRYHQLFADLLRDRQEMLRSGDIFELHQRASRWFTQASENASNAFVSEAIQHALAAKDYASAILLIEGHAMDMLMQWHVKTVDTWMQSIPPAWIAQSPRANLAFAWMHLMRANPAQAFAYLERLGAMFADPQNAVQITQADPLLEAKWLALQAMLLNAQGQQTESLKLCEKALTIVPSEGISPLPPVEIRTNTQVRSMIYLSLANAYQQSDDYEHAVEAYQQLIQIGQMMGNSVSELIGVSGLALLALQHGQYHFAFEIVSQGIERIERSGSLPPISTALFGELGVIHYQWHQLEKAHHYFQRSIQVSTLSGYSDAELYYGVILSRLFQIQGDLETAAEKIQKTVELMQVEAPAAVREEVIAQQIRIHLAQDDLPVAERLLEPHGFIFGETFAFPGLDTTYKVPQFSRDNLTRSVWLLYISALRVLLYRAQTKGKSEHVGLGIEVANHLIDDTLQNQYIPFALETLLVRAQLHLMQGDRAASQADFIQALQLGEPEGLISIFVEEGPPVVQALTDLLRQNQLGEVSSKYIEKILAAFPEDQKPKESPAPKVIAPPQEIIEPLSKRELEILHLIEAGYSNQEIADRLVVTLHTVKKHSSNIYSKLGVSSRTQAVARARQLNLL